MPTKMFLAKKNGIRILSSIIIAFLIVSMLAVNANNMYVDPPSVEETLFPGEYIEVEKEVMNPAPETRPSPVGGRDGELHR